MNQRYCVKGSEKKSVCEFAWSHWGEAGVSVSTRCNSTDGERVRKRKCLQRNNNETLNVQSCSNESPQTTEPCVSNWTDCIANTESNALVLYIGVGAAVSILLVLTVLPAILIHRWRKHVNSNATVNANIGISLCNSAVTSVNSPKARKTISDPQGDEDNASSSALLTQSHRRRWSNNVTSSLYALAATDSFVQEESVYDNVAVSSADGTALSTLLNDPGTPITTVIENPNSSIPAVPVCGAISKQSSIFDVLTNAAVQHVTYSTLEAGSDATGAVVGDVDQNDYCALEAR